MDIISRINSKRVVVGTHTFKRQGSMNRLIKSICEKCTLRDLSIIIVDDDPETCKNGTPVVWGDSYELASNAGYHLYEYKNDSGKHGITPARNFFLKKAIDFRADHIVDFDDDSYPGKYSIERMVAVQVQEPRFAFVGNVGGYTRFWRDFKKWDVKFYTSLGTGYSFLAEAIKKVGFQDENLVIRADHEFNIRLWKEGYWTACVWAPITHKRFSFREDGGCVPDNKSKEWLDDAEYIKNKYNSMIRTTRHGNIIPTFEYPRVRYFLKEDLTLVRTWLNRRPDGC